MENKIVASVTSLEADTSKLKSDFSELKRQIDEIASNMVKHSANTNGEISKLWGSHKKVKEESDFERNFENMNYNTYSLWRELVDPYAKKYDDDRKTQKDETMSVITNSSVSSSSHLQPNLVNDLLWITSNRLFNKFMKSSDAASIQRICSVLINVLYKTEGDLELTNKFAHIGIQTFTKMVIDPTAAVIGKVYKHSQTARRTSTITGHESESKYMKHFKTKMFGQKGDVYVPVFKNQPISAMILKTENMVLADMMFERDELCRTENTLVKELAPLPITVPDFLPVHAKIDWDLDDWNRDHLAFLGPWVRYLCLRNVSYRSTRNNLKSAHLSHCLVQSWGNAIHLMIHRLSSKVDQVSNEKPTSSIRESMRRRPKRKTRIGLSDQLLALAEAEKESSSSESSDYEFTEASNTNNII